MERKNVFKDSYSLFHILVHHTGVFGYSRRFTELSEFKSYFKDTPKDQILIVWLLYKSTVDPKDLYVQYEIRHLSEDDSLWQCSINGEPFPSFHCDNIVELIDKFEDHISNP
jgi:hypothetical protein